MRDYAYEALAEVSNSDQSIGRGQLNAALKAIRDQSPELSDSYLLSVEIHERAKAYRALWPEIALTPTALSKHWNRVLAETRKPSGTNLHADPPSSLPALSKQKFNLEQSRKILAMLEGASDE